MNAAPDRFEQYRDQQGDYGPVTPVLGREVMFEPGIMTGRVLKDLFEKTATGTPAIRWPLKMNEMPTHRGGGAGR